MTKSAKDHTWRKIRRMYRREMAASAAFWAQRLLAEHPDDALAWIYHGASLAQMSRYTEAMRAFRHAARLLPSGKLHLVYYHFGQSHERKGSFRQAEQWYRKAIRNCPSEGGYPLTLGRIMYRAGRLREAEAMLRRATKCKEGCHEEEFLFLGLTLCGLQRYKEARQCFMKALQIDPKYKEARKELSDIMNVLKPGERQALTA